MSDQSQIVLDRYRREGAAERYARLHRGRARHAREARCLRSALRSLGPGAQVLDLPCGTGRMLPALAELGFEITAADGSPAMTQHALEESRYLPAVKEVRVEDAFATHFPDRAFDAVVCNRLLHHLRIPEDRRSVLRELARISRRLVIVSFFSSHSIEAMRTRLSRTLGKRASQRGAISYACFRRDLAAAGLEVVRVIPTLAPISQQWYVVAARS